jgi:EmrB/QacA subfamily drug resistance transporter
VAFGLFMIMLDNTIVNVALPSIGRDLRMGVSQLEWIVNAYTLAFAVLILTGGRLADLFGRRRLFVIGLVVFSASSLVCGLSGGSALLTGARATQGVGAALIMPATLSIISATFAPAERGLAIGIWAGVSGIALAIGPLVGGLLTEHAGWSWIFFVNVPIGAIAILAARVLIAESRELTGRERIDLPGLAVSAAALFALTYALIEANRYGWGSPLIVALFVAAAVGLALFVRLERTRPGAMLDLSLFKSLTFTGANISALLVSLAMFGVFFFVSLYMQNILGWSAVRAGETFLPMTGLIILSAPLAGRLTDLFGPRWPIASGMALLAASLLLFSRLGLRDGFLEMLPGMLVGGLGMGLAMGPMTTAALSTVPVERAGVGSGVVSTFRQLGGTLGVAIMGAILAAAETVPASDPRFPLQYLTGFHHALRAAALIALGGAAVAALLLGRGARRQPRQAPSAAGGRVGVARN